MQKRPVNVSYVGIKFVLKLTAHFILNVLRICEITACFKSGNSGFYGYHLFFLSIKYLFTYLIIQVKISSLTYIQVSM